MRCASILFLACGCGGNVELKGDSATETTLADACSDGGTVDTYVAGLSRSSDAGVYEVILLEASPAPPDVGLNTFTVQIDGASGGVIRPWMPLHGHGTVPPTYPLTDNGDQTWTSGEIDLFMPGVWEIQVEVTGAAEDTAVFRFCLQG